MKTLSTILFGVVFLFLLKILTTMYHQISNFYTLYNNQATHLYFYNFNKEVLVNSPNLGLLLISVITLLATIGLAFSLLKILVVCKNMSIDTVFTICNSGKIIFTGYTLLFFGLSLSLATFVYKYYFTGLTISYHFTDDKAQQGYAFGYSMAFAIAKYLGIYVVAVFMLFLGAIIKKGVFLKVENELTI